jgi:hypothetical protein
MWGRHGRATWWVLEALRLDAIIGMPDKW